mgnify:CR=1 FL=1
MWMANPMPTNAFWGNPSTRTIKTSPVNAMLASSPASVIGLHPLFGPDLHTMQGQRIVLVPARLHDNSEWLPWIESLLGARGLLMVHATAEEHDEAMSIIQVLVHFSTEVMGLTLSRLGVPVEQLPGRQRGRQRGNLS